MDLQLLHNCPEKTHFAGFAKNNDVICHQEIHGRDEFSQAIQILGPTFPVIWHIHTV